MQRQFYVLISFPFFLVGLVVIGNGLYRYHRARASAGWMVAPGTVTWADSEKTRTIDGAERTRVEVQYTYAIDDRIFDGERITFARRASLPGEYLQALVETYQNQPAVDVYVNPNHPTEAVLQPGDTTGLIVVVGSGIIVLVIGLLAIGRGVQQGLRGIR
jgi:hypothetical protein